MNVSLFLVKYTVYPLCFSKAAKYFVTFKLTIFSYLLFGPTAPTSSAPCPASITIILFFPLELVSIEEEIDEGSVDGISLDFDSFLLGTTEVVFVLLAD